MASQQTRAGTSVPTTDAPPRRPRGAHLIGSVPASSARETFELVSRTLGRHLRRMSDGETGERAVWNSWTAPAYGRTEGLELVDPPDGNYTPWKQARLVVEPERLKLARLGFADAALESYRDFSELKDSGAIPEHVRFQVSLPSPIAPMIILVEESSRAAVEAAHVAQLFAEIDEILDGIPRDQLAIQWDVCQDVGIWERFFPAYFDDPEQGVVERLKRCAEKIPTDVELGFHLCYGDFEHKHFMNPRDLAVTSEIATRLTDAIDRSIQWIHLPVPIDRDDDDYFRPLQELELDPTTELYLGLLHSSDGEEGAWRRIAAANRFARRYGVATECGLARRPKETIPQLLELHARIAEPIVASA